MSVSMAGQERAVVRILTTVRQQSAFMALPVMIELPPSTAHALWARQVTGCYLVYFYLVQQNTSNYSLSQNCKSSPSLLSGCFCPVVDFHSLSFIGLLCHLDDACVSNPCHEDAICDTNPMNGRAICTCPPGFTGGACDQDVDECSIGERVAPFKSNEPQGGKKTYSLFKGLLKVDIS